MNRIATIETSQSSPKTRLGVLLSLMGFTMLALVACGGSSDAQTCAIDGAPTSGASAKPGATFVAEEQARAGNAAIEEADAKVYVLKPSADEARGPEAKPAPKVTKPSAAKPAKPAKPAVTKKTTPVAKPAPTPEKKSAGMQTFKVKSSFGIVAAALATGVDKRTPVGISDTFSTDTDKVWAFIKVKNRDEPTSVTMVWKKDGKKKWSYDLRVGKSFGWRTWSRKSVSKRDAGKWSVEVLDAEGRLLLTMPFTITKAGAQPQG